MVNWKYVEDGDYCEWIMCLPSALRHLTLGKFSVSCLWWFIDKNYRVFPLLHKETCSCWNCTYQIKDLKLWALEAALRSSTQTFEKRWKMKELVESCAVWRDCNFLINWLGVMATLQCALLFKYRKNAAVIVMNLCRMFLFLSVCMIPNKTWKSTATGRDREYWLVLKGTWMFAANTIAIHQVVVEKFQSGPKWLSQTTDQYQLSLEPCCRYGLK